MEISEVKVKLMRDRSDRLKAFCSITIDREFVIRDLKIIEGTKGMFVAMPSRKINDKCQTCGAKNHLRAKFCNECGSRLNENRAGRDAEGRTKLHADIAHPINSACRERMQKKIVAAYDEEVERSAQPGYRPSYEEEFTEEDYHEGGYSDEPAARGASHDAAPVTPPAGPARAASEDETGESGTFGAGIF